MNRAVMPPLLAAALAAGAAMAEENSTAYWHSWAQDFTQELKSELGALYSPRFAGKVVKGAPYSAEVVTEARQMLADGNEINRRKTGAVYRDTEGRTRQETGPEGKERTVFISDPVANTHFVLTPGAKRAVSAAPRAMSYKYDARDKQVVRVGSSEIRVEDGHVFVDGKAVPGSGRIELQRGGKRIVVENNQVTIDGKPLGEGGSRHVVVRSVQTGDGKRHEEASINVIRAEDGKELVVTPGTPLVPVPPVPPVPGVAPAPPAPPVPPPLPGINTMRFESTARLGKGVTTSLGAKDFDGVRAEGKSTTWTIPAGEIGNRNAIMVVSETWYAPELQVTVYARHSDPRTGESVYRLANIRRGEPPADLFKVPDDYQVKGRAKG